MSLTVLGIESSCDETSAAVVRGREVLSNVIASQLDVHERFGGVVPELASRAHLEAIVPMVRRALQEASVTLDDLDGIAATCGPGLIGALLVGLNFAKALAASRSLPFIGVNHLDGHLNAGFLEAGTSLEYPFVALLVSGGHTHTYDATGFGAYESIGRTRDDAAGEAFDKVAKLLGLGYPGGPIIDRIAANGDPNAFAFPRAMKKSDDFSFSGLKTAVRVATNELDDLQPHVADLAASFQEAVVDVLVDKTLRAAKKRGRERVVVSGGVAANSRLREKMASAAAEAGIEPHFPSPILCTDNAAMIAYVGAQHLGSGSGSALDLNAASVLALV